MKQNSRKLFASLLAAALSLSLLTTCASAEASDETENPNTASEASSSDTSNVFDFPVMGLTVALPDTLMERMEQRTVTAFRNEHTEDGSSLQYGYLIWKLTTEEDLSKENLNPDDLPTVGVLGVYQTELADSLDDLTGCDRHEEIGESADSTYKYYLSLDTSADAALLEELQDIRTTITEMEDYAEYYGISPDFSGASLGDFTTQDVSGNTVTPDIFKDYDLTLVNVFATWCSPCIAEIPDLEKLHQQMADKSVGVVGVVLDAADQDGEVVQTALEQAQLLVEKLGVTYPVILPDATHLNGRVANIQAVPETFFVDKDGNIVGETYSGSRSLEDWTEIVENELAALDKEM